MLSRGILLALPVALATCLVAVPRAAAVAPEIKDDAKFFSADAVKKANEMIRTIARKHNRDLMVETFNTVPGNQTEKVKDLPTNERTKFFENWAKERMEHHAVNGVYLLVCKEPTFLRVEISDNARGTFGGQFAGELAKLLVKDFKEKKYDDALMQAVKQVQDKLGSGKPKK